jgi:uncharacterized protein YchJ
MKLKYQFNESMQQVYVKYMMKPAEYIFSMMKPSCGNLLRQKKKSDSIGALDVIV